MNKSIINYVVDICLLISAILIIVTGVIRLPFLGLYRYIRFYGLSQLHDWSGVAFVVFGLVHIVLHWNWIVSMTKNYLKRK